MKQCRSCGEREDLREMDFVTLHDGTGMDLPHHVAYEEDHHPSCHGNCVEVNCPVMMETLCGPVVDLGHGGDLQRGSDVRLKEAREARARARTGWMREYSAKWF